MKTLAPSDLPTLAAEVKDLVQDGIYGLYALKALTPEGGAYVLVTSAEELYVLSPGGGVVASDGARDLSSFEVSTPVTFTGYDGVRVNQGR